MSKIAYFITQEIPESLNSGEYWLEPEDDVLVQYIDDEPARIVYVDGGEPEDMYLRRNLQTLVSELNRLARLVDND